MTRRPSGVMATSRSTALIVSAVVGVVVIARRETRGAVGRVANHTPPPAKARPATRAGALYIARRRHSEPGRGWRDGDESYAAVPDTFASSMTNDAVEISTTRFRRSF